MCKQQRLRTDAKSYLPPTTEDIGVAFDINTLGRPILLLGHPIEGLWMNLVCLCSESRLCSVSPRSFSDSMFGITRVVTLFGGMDPEV